MTYGRKIISAQEGRQARFFAQGPDQALFTTGMHRHKVDKKELSRSITPRGNSVESGSRSRSGDRTARSGAKSGRSDKSSNFMYHHRDNIYTIRREPDNGLRRN